MWYLEKPSEKELNTYKELFYEKIKNKIDKDGCLKFLFNKDNTGKDYIEKLLISEPEKLNKLNKKLIKKLFQRNLLKNLKNTKILKERKRRIKMTLI